MSKNTWTATPAALTAVWARRATEPVAHAATTSPTVSAQSVARETTTPRRVVVLLDVSAILRTHSVLLGPRQISDAVVQGPAGPVREPRSGAGRGHRRRRRRGGGRRARRSPHRHQSRSAAASQPARGPAFILTKQIRRDHQPAGRSALEADTAFGAGNDRMAVRSPKFAPTRPVRNREARVTEPQLA
jgi:hypothetical protein